MAIGTSGSGLGQLSQVLRDYVRGNLADVMAGRCVATQADIPFGPLVFSKRLGYENFKIRPDGVNCPGEVGDGRSIAVEVEPITPDTAEIQCAKGLRSEQSTL